MKNRLANIELLLLDVDGVLTDAGITYTDSGEQTKKFNAKDGLGLRLLMDAGIQVGIITGLSSKALEHRCSKLGISLLFAGIKNKSKVLDSIISQTGIDPEKIRAKMLEKCPELKNNNNLNDYSWVIQQIFNPGFSSRDEVSEFSGRGVGMDAIKTAVESLGGTIHANSKIGIGTDIHIFVPSQTDLSPFAKSA